MRALPGLTMSELNYEIPIPLGSSSLDGSVK